MSKSDHAALLKEAAAAASNAHAPYSGNARGVVLVAEDGSKFVGVNVEFANYAGSLCAEQVALGQAIAAGKRKFVTLAMSPECYPCGNCRQGLSEFGVDLDIVIIDKSANISTVKLSDLLPNLFGSAQLG